MSPVDRFVEILQDGHSLYGLGAGCDEWRAQPGDPDIDMEENTNANGENTIDEPVGRHAPWSFAGRLTAPPDSAGRIYGFSYQVYLDKHPLHLGISGRGGWSPAAGVMIPSADQPGYFIIGSATYCTTEVDVRSDPRHEDAVRVGDETWYLSRDACLRSRRDMAAVRGCPKGRTR